MFLRACSVLFCLSGPVVACDIALMLAVDVSGSVDPSEYDIQMQGLALALRDGSVAEALIDARASVAVMQWTGSRRAQVTTAWRDIGSYEDIQALSEDIATQSRLWRSFSTAIGEALQVAIRQFEDVPHCRRRVIDVSGDGVSNEGIDPKAVRPALAQAGITVNGLAIAASLPILLSYYRTDVIFGPGAFAIEASSFEAYPERIRLKLLREVTKQVSSLQ